MRILFTAIPLSLLLVSPLAGAQSHDYPLTGDTVISTVQVRPTLHPFPVTEQQTEAIKGDYALTNGWHLRVQSSYKGIIAQIDQQRPMSLIALSEDKFVTRDGNVAMEFNQGTIGEDMTMSYVPTSNVAALLTVGTKGSLASR
ncbi:hypothetical protein GCM10027321_34950 [Massilia terrae]|uniref:Uncharacterized protein n=1 Tax=Massilia terrae TaxID=1811224 RepID=A0ABT2D389_9BURK|nr:hypothetical protein [Massilia terrae]MCS0660704.1 hypothetical protein [Massilia terrae]